MPEEEWMEGFRPLGGFAQQRGYGSGKLLSVALTQGLGMTTLKSPQALAERVLFFTVVQSLSSQENQYCHQQTCFSKMPWDRIKV
jgi:hypothetical protein